MRDATLKPTVGPIKHYRQLPYGPGPGCLYLLAFDISTSPISRLGSSPEKSAYKRPT